MNARLPILDERPQTYGDCLREGWGDHDATGPCPWVGCTHHLAWAVVEQGNVAPNPGDERLVERVDALDLDTMAHTCALRAADGEHTLAEVGAFFSATRVRIGQIEGKAFEHLRARKRIAMLEPLRDEGRQVSRPDLSEDKGWGLSRDEMHRAELRVNPQAVAIANEARARMGKAPVNVVADVLKAPPVRVLQGAEREQRIRELKARGGAARQQPEETVMGRPRESDTESGTKALAALDEYAHKHGMSRSKASRAVGMSSSTLHCLTHGKGCTPETLERVQNALATHPVGAVKQRKSPKPQAPKPARATPAASTLTLDQLPRLIEVIARLGGIDRAERIADAIGGAL